MDIHGFCMDSMDFIDIYPKSIIVIENLMNIHPKIYRFHMDIHDKMHVFMKIIQKSIKNLSVFMDIHKNPSFLMDIHRNSSLWIDIYKNPSFVYEYP